MARSRSIIVFFFNDTATTEIYTLSLHDALPIFGADDVVVSLLEARHVVGVALMFADGNLSAGRDFALGAGLLGCLGVGSDRKSTRLNSSHTVISYAVFCLQKKK